LDAASPASRARVREQFNPHPGPETPLGCPNPECRNPDRLRLVETTHVDTGARFYDVGVTAPEIDRDDDEQVSPVLQHRTVIGARCDECGWAVTGTLTPWRLLVPVQ
jgi:hypothetical protein